MCDRASDDAEWRLQAGGFIHPAGREFGIDGIRELDCGKDEYTTEQSTEGMRAPYGFEIIENCVACPHRQDRIFCNLSSHVVEQLAEITSAASYPRGATLFVEAQAARGVFILCTGKVKLSTSSIDGRTLIVRIAEAGEVLGLAATVIGKPYELSAEVIEPAQANFISRTDFLDFLRQNGEVSLRVAQQLGETYHAAVSEIRSIGLSHSAGEKLARFMLDWCAHHGNAELPLKAPLTLTHEEIAQKIGASRETVSRAFAVLKKKRLVQIKGSTLIILDREKLAAIANV
jgi:CRP/FNR family cyclic AMP-dependent transcriptional regulator